MRNQSTNSQCVLCGQDAIYRRTDMGNCRFYQCSNPDCGEYEISGSAADRLKDAEDFKKDAMKKAKACRGTDEILVITRTSRQDVTAKIVRRQGVAG